MFPESVRNSTSTAAKGVTSGAKWLYNFAGKTVWILSTSFVILALPVIFEVERVQTEEAQLQQQRQVSSLLINYVLTKYSRNEKRDKLCDYWSPKLEWSPHSREKVAYFLSQIPCYLKVKLISLG